MPEPLALFASLLAFFIAAASPGPATLALAQVAMARGRRGGLLFGAGLSVGLAVWGLVAASGAGPLLVQSAWALTAMKVAGGFYLFYLAVTSARAAVGAQAGHVPVTVARPFRAGLFLNLANPKAILAWLAVMALGLAPAAEAGAVLVIVLACSLLGCGIYAGYGLLFSLPPARRAYVRARRGIDAVAAVLFGLLGLRLLFGRIGSAA